MASKGLSALEAALPRQELRILRDRSVIESALVRKADLVAEPRIRALRPENLNSTKILHRPNRAEINDEREQNGFPKVMLGSAYRI
jgi:hypothetical protein